MNFNEVWEILLDSEDTDPPEQTAKWRLQALITLLKDEKRLAKTNDRFIRNLRAGGAIPVLQQMFGVKSNEPTATTRPVAEPVDPFEETSRVIFG